MMNQKDIHNMDEGSAMLADCWSSMFDRMVRNGLTRGEALQILIAWIEAMSERNKNEE